MTVDNGIDRERAMNETRDVARTAAGATKDVAHEGTNQVAAVAGEARQQLSSVVDQAKGELRSQFDQRGQQAATGLRTLSEQLTALSQGRTDAAGHVGTLVTDAQQRVQAYAQSIEQRGPQGLLDDVSRFARRRPGTFLLAATAAGFAAGRLARAGAAAQHEQGASNSNGFGTPSMAQVSYSDPYGQPLIAEPTFTDPTLADPGYATPSFAEPLRGER